MTEEGEAIALAVETEAIVGGTRERETRESTEIVGRDIETTRENTEIDVPDPGQLFTNKK